MHLEITHKVYADEVTFVMRYRGMPLLKTLMENVAVASMAIILCKVVCSSTDGTFSDGTIYTIFYTELENRTQRFQFVASCDHKKL